MVDNYESREEMKKRKKGFVIGSGPLADAVSRVLRKIEENPELIRKYNINRGYNLPEKKSYNPEGDNK